MATPGKCVHCGGPVGADSFVCDSCLDAAFDFLGMSEKPAVKSSTSVMQASVCPSCGHKMDGARGDVSGSFGPDGKACTCVCHA